MTEVRGISLHIGLNRVDPAGYAGWSGELVACENDARDMEAIAGQQGFAASTLLTDAATSTATVDAIRSAAEALGPGDIFFLTYSGHGGQVPDGNEDEPEHMDETWCLFDREFVDDELYSLWASFAQGARIAVLSDSCHSGSVTRDAHYAAKPDPVPRYKMLPRDIERLAFDQNRAVYDAIQSANPQGRYVGIGAFVLLISGCQDNQTSADGDVNGLFTQRLLEVWDGGTYTGDYPTLCRSVTDRMPPDQTPNYFPVGQINAAFEAQRPFTI